MYDNEYVKAWMGGRCVLVPIKDYYKMHAVSHGLERYDDLRSEGCQIVAPNEIYDEKGNPVLNQDNLEPQERKVTDGGMAWQSLS